MAQLDELSGYFVPTFCPTSTGLVCACDMCFDVHTGPCSAIGPHDLHCVCNNCMQFASDDSKYQQSLAVRYPVTVMSDDENAGEGPLVEIFDSLPFDTREALELLYQNLSPDIKEKLSNLVVTLVDDGEVPPPNSPTNQDMHAYNGNQFHQHHHGWGDFIRAAGRGLARSTNPADKFALAGLGSAGLIGSALGYTSTQNMSKPLSELRVQLFGGVEKHDPNKWQKVLPKTITNKEMHAVNGNIKHEFGDTWKDTAERVIHSEDDIKHHSKNKFGDEWLANAEKIIHMDGPKRAPSNKEMHTINGNIYGPMNVGVKEKTHKNQLRRLARKINKQRSNVKVNKKKGRVIVNNKIAIAKRGRRSNVPRKDIKQLKAEDRLAAKYTAFLKNPVFRPPPLGSTGQTPVKLLHGFKEITISMGTLGGLACTEFIAFLSPKLFGLFTSVSNYTVPITYGGAVNGTVNFQNVASNSAMVTSDFENLTSLKNEAGNTNSTSPVPMVRFVGGHVSLRCRCPMSTTAPPYLFGGLLPSQVTAASNPQIVDTSSQLTALTSTAIRALPSTVEIDGFDVSSVYIPGSAKSLDFSNFVAQYNATNMDSTAVPYIGMSGCPTTATVTLVVSAWFEIQQNVVNQNYSGWQLGPKVSTEDIYDRIKRFKTVNPVLLQEGGKTNSGSRGAAFTIAEFIKPTVYDPQKELDDLRNQLTHMNERFKKLTVETNSNSEDDEKFSHVSTPESPQYRSLSRSTIDLALHLKDKLTPGSVTSKTSRVSLP